MTIPGLEQIKKTLTRLWTNMPEKTKADLPALFHKSPRLDPIRYIAKREAGVKWALYSKAAIRNSEDDAPKILKHELYDILETPCPNFPEIDGWQLRFLTFAHVRLVGEFFWLKVRDGSKRGRIVALLPIPSIWVNTRPTVNNHNYTIYPYGVTSGNSVTVPADDVVWFKDPDLSDPYANGRGATESILDELEIDENAAKFQKAALYNGVSSSFAIVAEGATEPQVKQIKENFVAKVAGFFNVKQPPVLAAPGARIEKLGDTMKELDMIETRKYLRDEALQHHQVPPELYGIIEHSNRSTIDAADYLFSKNVMSDDLCFYERVVTLQVCREFDDDICIVHDNIIREDDEFDLKVYDLAVARGIATENEFRTRFGMREQKDGDVRILPISIMRVPVGETVAPTEPAPEPPAPKSSVPDDTILDIEDEELDIEDDTGAKATRTKSAADTEARKVAIWKMFDTKSTSGEEPFRRAAKKIADVQGEKFATALTAALKKSMTAAAIDTAVDAVFADETHRAVKQTLAPAWINSLKDGKAHALEVLGNIKSIKADESVYNAAFNAWIEKYGLEKAKQIDETTAEELRRYLVPELSASIARGDGEAETIKNMLRVADDVWVKLSTTRAERIARTETAATVNAGTHVTYASEGVERREWLSVRDDRTRDGEDGGFNHASMDGVVVDIDKPFDVSGESLMYPGDPTNASAGNIINCRCTIAPVFND